MVNSAARPRKRSCSVRDPTKETYMKRTICFVIVALAEGTLWLNQFQKGASGENAHKEAEGAIAAPARYRHIPAMIREKHGSSATAGNWSGYAVTGAKDSVTNVKGSWIVPAVDCAVTPNADSSLWVGIDGYNSNSVEQIGTDSNCVNGQPVYSAWYEFYPHWAYGINMTVRPGDIISGEVNAGTKGMFTVKLTNWGSIYNSKNPQTFTTSQKMNNAARSSAEWIVEAPWS